MGYTSVDGYTDPLPPHVNSLMLSNGPGESQNESGIFGSDVTGSSHDTQKHDRGYMNDHGQTSSEMRYPRKFPEIPAMFQQPPLIRSASVDDNLAPVDQYDPSVVLAKLHRRRNTAGRLPLTSLSQQEPYESYGRYYGFQSPNQMSLSQVSHPGPLRQHHLEHNDPYYSQRKRGSPASSSDTSSLASEVRNRLASAPGSVLSFGSALSTSTVSSFGSSRSGSKGVLPRPPSLPGSSSGSSTSILPPKPIYTAIPEYPRHARSEAQNFPQFSQNQRLHYDSDRDEESQSMPALSSMKQNMPPRAAPPPSEAQPRERAADIHKRRKKERGDQHPKIPEESSSRDSLQIKIEMVLSVLSVVNSSSKEQNDADAAKFLLALSRSADTCSVMRQPACMNMLIQIMHNIEHKGDVSHHEVRLRAAETMRNIIESTGETRQGKHELCVLGVLEKIRIHCDMLFEFIASLPAGQRIDPVQAESIQAACDQLLHPIRKLYKYSNEKDKYRPAILSLGGIQATSEVLIVNYRLIAAQKSIRSGEKPICHSSKIVTVVISILINLTYGDVSNKSSLCVFPFFLKSLVFHLRQQNESISASAAQVLRNLSWRATADIKDALLKYDTSVALMAAIEYVKDETTIQHITSALWNLSAHSLESRHKICSTHFGIRQLVELLSYNSPSGTTAVVENVGGILKNLSVVIMQDEKYRRKFRESGGLAKLAQHLKSKNRTVLANATGILWNLSARYPEDQKLLWDLGCIPLLDVHQTSDHKSIAENARGALRNLLAFGQTNGWTSKSDVMGYNLKTQKGLSKSLSYAANYTFGQSSHSKHSNESLHSRFSQPVRSKSGGDGSSSSLSQPKSSSERRHDSHGYQYPDDDDDHPDYGMHTKKNKNRLALSRISSAPQASIQHDDLDMDEWSSYMPYAGSKHSVAKIHMEDQPRRKTRSSKSRSGNRGSVPYSLSQSVSNSELNSVNASHMGLSPANLSNEPGGSTSLSALESKFDGFDPSQPSRTHEVYADLELDLEDDDNEDIDRPIRCEREESGDQSGDMYSEGFPHSRRSSAVMLGRQSPGKHGTRNLALDGTVHKNSKRSKEKITTDI